MKKLTTLIIALAASISSAFAGVVSQSTAQTVATNCYSQTYGVTPQSVTLGYSENDANGTVAYYVFNMGDNGGFVIVSAENAGRPIIAIGNTGKYGIPTGTNNNLDFWMKKRNKEITDMRTNNVTADAAVTAEWNGYINNTVLNKPVHKTEGVTFPSSTAYLVQSTWDQQYYPYPYNYFAPPTLTGSTASTQSVTGCVATTMAQIMRYWSYPPKGTGSSSYCDCTSGGFKENYGTLSANYAKTNYNWAAMLYSPSSTTAVNASDTEIARVMFDAGVSVDMDYSPSGSGAIVNGAKPSAQYSYVNYFGYSNAILHGLNEASDTMAWKDTIEKDLNKGRPVQYFGTDPSLGGHTWVCDGWNSIGAFHMNWGWSGTSDGWYTLGKLAPKGEPDDFTTSLGALIGITPPPLAPVAAFTANFTTVPVGGYVNFTDLSTGYPTSWAWTFTGALTGTSAVENPTSIQYMTPGTYAVSLKVTNSAGTNTATKTAYINVVASNTCDTLSNLPANPYLVIGYQTANAAQQVNGYISGCYGDTIQQVAEYFATVPSTGFTIGSAYIYFGIASSKTAGRTVNVNIWDNTGTGGAPGVIKATKAVTVSTIQAADKYSSGPTLVTFTTPVTVTTPFYIGVDFTTIATAYKTDTIVIVTDTNNNGTAATAWQYDVATAYGLNGWNTLASVWNLNLSNAIWPIFCSSGTVGMGDVDLEEGVKLYPNPTSGIVNAELSLEQSTDVHVEVYNMLGQVVQTAHWDNANNATYTLDLSAQAPGMYFVKLITDKSTITRKIMLNR